MPLIAIASPKGGVGKTTLTAHLAAILAGRGFRVTVLDLDPQNALRLHLGVSIREHGGFMARLLSKPDWRGCLHATACGATLLPFGAAEPAEVLDIAAAIGATPALLAAPVQQMLSDPDLILLVDTPPGPGTAVAALYPLIDLMVLVLLADAGSASLIPQIAANSFMGRGTLAHRAAERAVVVLNQFAPQAALSTAVLEMAQRALGPRLLGAIARDEAVAEALADKRLLTEPGPGAADDMQVFADAITRHAKLQLPGARRPGFSALDEWRG
jgi:cellulose synthase operon protein YhjQ